MNKGKPYATTNMIMLVVISATSLQLIPSTVIGMRIAHGSAAPTAFLLPCIISTVTSTVIGVLFVKICARIFGDEPRERRNKSAKTDGSVTSEGDLPAHAAPLYEAATPRAKRGRTRKIRKKA